MEHVGVKLQRASPLNLYLECEVLLVSFFEFVLESKQWFVSEHLRRKAWRFVAATAHIQNQSIVERELRRDQLLKRRCIWLGRFQLNLLIRNLDEFRALDGFFLLWLTLLIGSNSRQLCSRLGAHFYC